MDTSVDGPPGSITAHLLRDETIVWWGQPAQGFRLAWSDAFLIPFSLLWGGFAIFWEISVLKTSGPSTFSLFGLPFVLIGLFLIFGRFVVDAWLRTHIVYALTDRRVLIVRSGLWPSVSATSLDRLPASKLTEASDGRGTIRFGPEASFFGSMNNSGFAGGWIAALDPTPQFIAIAHAHRVFAAIQERSAEASR